MTEQITANGTAVVLARTADQVAVNAPEPSNQHLEHCFVGSGVVLSRTSVAPVVIATNTTNLDVARLVPAYARHQEPAAGLPLFSDLQALIQVFRN
jgi:hypothetical protein